MLVWAGAWEQAGRPNQASGRGRRGVPTSRRRQFFRTITIAILLLSSVVALQILLSGKLLAG